jgi:hypothetical protein
MVHLRRENAQVYLLHLKGAIIHSIQKRDGFVVLPQLLNYML